MFSQRIISPCLDLDESLVSWSNIPYEGWTSQESGMTMKKHPV